MKAPGEITVTPADAEIGGSVSRAAVMATVAGLGTLAGAVYVASPGVEEEIVPIVELPPGTALTSQAMGALESCTVAENSSVCSVTTLSVVGEMLTLAVDATIVAVVFPDIDKSVCRIAVMVTAGGLGIVAGAV